MEDIEKITKSLREEADEKIEEIQQNAEKEVEKEKEKAQEKAERESERIIKEGEQEAEDTARRILSSARTKARRKKLKFKAEMSEEIIQEAMEELDSVKEDEERYREIMKKLTIDGGISVGGGDLEIAIPKGENPLSEEDIDEIESDISDETGKETSIEIVKELSESKKGVLVRQSDGTLQSNNTFEARLDRMRDSLRTRVTKILFND